MKLLIDFDGVLVDFEREFRVRYNNLLDRFSPDTPRLEEKLENYNLWENGLDDFFILEALKEMEVFQMRTNKSMIEFIDKLNKNSIDYRIVTARQYSKDEVTIVLEKTFNVPRDLIWFIPDKSEVLPLFDYIIEDNPEIEGDNVFMVAHKYNECATNVKFRGASKQIIEKLTKILKLKQY